MNLSTLFPGTGATYWAGVVVYAVITALWLRLAWSLLTDHDLDGVDDADDDPLREPW